MSTTETEPKLTNAEYHNHDAISNSKMKVFRKSRRLYYETFVTKRITTSPTPAMLLGSLTHCMTLEPDMVTRDFARIPKCDRRTKEGKATYESFLQGLSATHQCVDSETWANAEEISKALLANSAVNQLLGLSGPVEEPMFWIDEITGLPCRGKFDKIASDEDLIIDIKTTTASTPGEFAKSVVGLGYARQAAWYLEGYRRLHGVNANFVFIAVQTSEPYEIGLYELDAADLSRATEQNKRLMDALAFCHANNAWASTHETEVVKLSLPRYAAYEDEYLPY